MITRAWVLVSIGLWVVVFTKVTTVGWDLVVKFVSNY